LNLQGPSFELQMKSKKRRTKKVWKSNSKRWSDEQKVHQETRRRKKGIIQSSFKVRNLSATHAKGKNRKNLFITMKDSGGKKKNEREIAGEKKKPTSSRRTAISHNQKGASVQQKNSSRRKKSPRRGKGTEILPRP